MKWYKSQCLAVKSCQKGTKQIVDAPIKHGDSLCITETELSGEIFSSVNCPRSHDKRKGYCFFNRIKKNRKDTKLL